MNEKHELTDEQIDETLNALAVSWWDVPQDATTAFARAIIAADRALRASPAAVGPQQIAEPASQCKECNGRGKVDSSYTVNVRTHQKVSGEVLTTESCDACEGFGYFAEPAMRACVNGFSQNPGRCDAWCGDDRTCPRQRYIKGAMSQVPATQKEQS